MLLRDSRGAAAVEFALTIGVLTVLLLGTVQIGAALSARAEMSHALGQVVRVVHMDATVTQEEVESALQHRLAGGRTSTYSVNVEEIEGERALRIVVLFDHELSLPFVPMRTLTMRVETLAPAVLPES